MPVAVGCKSVRLDANGPPGLKPLNSAFDAALKRRSSTIGIAALSFAFAGQPRRLSLRVSSVLVEVVGSSFCFCDEERLHAFGADGDHVVLILQDTFDSEEALAGQQKAIFVKQIGANDRVRDPGLVFQA